MNRIGSYGVFQNSFYDRTKAKSSTAQKQEEKKSDSVKSKKASDAKKSFVLSDAARALLEELKKKYNDMDFMVAEYETEEEASEYLSRGSKAFSVLIDPETLEEMAADEDVKAEYMQVMDDSRAQLSGMIEELDEEEEGQVKRVGISIDKDGSVSYFAELEKTSAKQRERIEKTRADKAEQAKADKKDKAEKLEEKKAAAGKSKKAVVEAGSIEELLEKIRSFNWDEVQERETKQTGGKIDFTA